MVVQVILNNTLKIAHSESPLVCDWFKNDLRHYDMLMTSRSISCLMLQFTFQTKVWYG